MVDENNVENINNQNQDNLTPPTNKDGGEGGSQPTWQELAGLDPKEFDTPEKLAKQYKEARKGLTDQGQKLKESDDFKTQVTPVLKAVYSNPDLFKKVTEEVNKLYGKTDDKGSDTPVRDPRVEELAGMEEARLISEFENEVKLNTRSSESQSEMKRELGSIMQRWLVPGSKPSLQQLPTMLRDAWKIYKSEHSVTEEPDEKLNFNLGFGTPRAVQAIVDKMDINSLSPQERKAAEKMGISIEDYLKEKKTIMSR